ncbi:phosphoribosyltransferase [Methylocystis parvus]|uniref:Phosphoribosyltransferase n=1 Tax=Methylocystis parvus TaxID=134 RepID=A0A6B8LW85_9HYPH|nr:phosphoribosyltransferase family protein [Methylocystis parvus]QGM96677.1 phosphoribosyltransferase [Methylocystis parvus]WBJ99458.1 phosphoribosyltransferase [Methylocystis parvus OBBP]
MPFRDRAQAGARLAKALAAYKGKDAVVFALPRGGVPVAAPIADALHAPLDLSLVRKIGVPGQPELAMGAIANGGAPIVVRNEDVIALAGVSECQFERACAEASAEIARRRRLYFGDRPRASAAGRIAIVADDGVATGATTRAALRAVRAQEPSKLILAVPVAPGETLDMLGREADEIVCLETHDYFMGVGCYYDDFRQIEDDEVVSLLERYGPRRPRG